MVCRTCQNRNVKFDPFMHLSLPIPDKGTMLVTIALIRYSSHPPAAMKEKKWEEMEDGRIIRLRSGAICCSLNLCRSGRASDIREHISKLCGIEAQRLALTNVYKGRITQILMGNENLSTLRTNILVVAYEQPMPIPELETTAGKSVSKSSHSSIFCDGSHVKPRFLWYNIILVLSTTSIISGNDHHSIAVGRIYMIGG